MNRGYQKVSLRESFKERQIIPSSTPQLQFLLKHLPQTNARVVSLRKHRSALPRTSCSSGSATPPRPNLGQVGVPRWGASCRRARWAGATCGGWQSLNQPKPRRATAGRRCCAGSAPQNNLWRVEMRVTKQLEEWRFLLLSLQLLRPLQRHYERGVG